MCIKNIRRRPVTESLGIVVWYSYVYRYRSFNHLTRPGHRTRASCISVAHHAHRGQHCVISLVVSQRYGWRRFVKSIRKIIIISVGRRLLNIVLFIDLRSILCRTQQLPVTFTRSPFRWVGARPTLRFSMCGLQWRQRPSLPQASSLPTATPKNYNFHTKNHWTLLLR